MLMLEPTPKVITFDCYGTLVQWHQAMRGAALSVLSAHLGTMASETQAASLADKVRATAVAHQQRPPYRRSSLEEALAAVGHAATNDDHRTLWSSLSRVTLHPDTSAALPRLRTRYRLAIISNTDDDLIDGTVSASTLRSTLS